MFDYVPAYICICICVVVLRLYNINANLKTTYLCRNITVKHMTTNMRAQLSGNEETKEFPKLFLDIRDDKIPRAVHTDTINIPEKQEKEFSSLEVLKAEVYPCLASMILKSKWLAERTFSFEYQCLPT